MISGNPLKGMSICPFNSMCNGSMRNCLLKVQILFLHKDSDLCEFKFINEDELTNWVLVYKTEIEVSEIVNKD